MSHFLLLDWVFVFILEKDRDCCKKIEVQYQPKKGYSTVRNIYFEKITGSVKRWLTKKDVVDNKGTRYCIEKGIRK